MTGGNKTCLPDFDVVEGWASIFWLWERGVSWLISADRWVDRTQWAAAQITTLLILCCVVLCCVVLCCVVLYCIVCIQYQLLFDRKRWLSQNLCVSMPITRINWLDIIPSSPAKIRVRTNLGSDSVQHLVHYRSTWWRSIFVDRHRYNSTGN